MCRKIIILCLMLRVVMESSCFAFTRIPFSTNFNIQEFVQNFNSRHMEQEELTIVSIKTSLSDNGNTRYKCIFSDNYSYLLLETSGQTLWRLSGIALPKNGYYQKAINSIYSAARIVGAPGTRNDFLNALDAVFNKKGARMFACGSKGYGDEYWGIEAGNVKEGYFVGIAVWKR